MVLRLKLALLEARAAADPLGESLGAEDGDALQATVGGFRGQIVGLQNYAMELKKALKQESELLGIAQLQAKKNISNPRFSL